MQWTQGEQNLCTYTIHGIQDWTANEMVALGIATSLSNLAMWVSRLATWSSPAARGVSEVWCHSCTMLHYFIDKQQTFDLSGRVWSRLAFAISSFLVEFRMFFFAEPASLSLSELMCAVRLYFGGTRTEQSEHIAMFLRVSCECRISCQNAFQRPIVRSWLPTLRRSDLQHGGEESPTMCKILCHKWGNKKNRQLDN